LAETKKFKWDPSCLIPDQIELDFGALDPKGPFIMREMSRNDLMDFVVESIDKKFVDEEGNRQAFVTTAREQEAVLWKYFSLSTSYGETSNKRTVKFFEELKLTGSALGNLIEAFFEINHLDEILATGGNWLMLPNVRAIQRQTEAEENES
jgi:hypothetical protein